MNSYTITEQCIAEGAHAILSQKRHRTIILGLFVIASLAAASVAWTSAGNDSHLKIGSWDLSLLFSHAIKTTAALMVAAATFGILHGVLTSLTKGYVQRMCALWVAKTGGAMTVQIEDKAIKYDAENGGTLFLCSDVTSVVRSKSHVAYVVSDQQKRMIAFLPVPQGEKSFIDAMNQHLRPEVLAKTGGRPR